MAVRKLKGIPAQQAIQKYQQLRGLRGNFESVWQSIGDYIIPRKNDIQSQDTPGAPKYNDILDSTAMTSLELLTGALHSLLTNPSGYFFNLTTGIPELDNQDEVRMWLQQVVRKMHYVLSNSNFQTEVQEFYTDLAGFGTGVMSVEEDAETIVRFATRPLKEIFVEENAKGMVDSVYRLYCMDARMLVDEFGLEQLPEKIQKQYKEGKYTEKHEVLHAVYPAKQAKNQDKRFQFVSQYILVSQKVEIAPIKGFREKPYIVSRWSKVSGEVYGRGLGERALPEAKTCNKMTETTLRGAQKVVDPPLQAPDDGFVLPLITRPAGLNYYRAGSTDRIETIFNDSRIDFGFQAIENERQKIREAFYSEQLMLRRGPQMTAEEVQTRVEQSLRFLGPMLGRQQSEFLQPLVERLYAIMDRRGQIPDVPAVLDGVPLRVQYSSVMAMAQRMSELQNIQRTWSAVAPFMTTQPEIADNFDGDAATHYVAKLLNFPQELLRNRDNVAEIRKKRAEMAQQQMEQESRKNEADATSKFVGAAAKLKGA